MYYSYLKRNSYHGDRFICLSIILRQPIAVLRKRLARACKLNQEDPVERSD